MKLFTGCLLLLGAFCSTTLHAAETGLDLKSKLSRVQLPGVQDKIVSVFPSPAPEWTVYCFLGSECPLAKLYGARLEQLSQKYAGKVRFVGVNSNLQDSMDETRAYVQIHAITFDFVKDYDHHLADLLEAERTPEVVVVDAAGTICYRGRIDDQYQPGTIKEKPASQDLMTALEELLAGKPVTVTTTEPVGCLIGRTFEGEVTTKFTYCKDIARLLQKHCVECHRPDEIGPFSLTDYDEVIGWGEMSVEVVDQGRMPPWHANPKHGAFANARGMTENEKQILRDWVQGGMPYGDVKDLPQQEKYLEGWQLARTPDVVLPMSKTPYQVPAEGVVEYQYFVVDPGFEKDEWVIGAQVLPGNRAVVHHCIVFVRPPDGEDFRGTGWIAAYVPGQRSTMLPEGCGRLVPAGSQLVFQMHYTPTGTAQSDCTKLGLLLGNDKNIHEEVVTVTAINRNFEIPPQDANFAVSGGTNRVPREGRLLAMAPHMHYRGKSFRAIAEQEDGQAEILLDVPHYDFNWQHVYEMQNSLPLNKISRLEFTCHFDNSAGNPFNPDPTAYVTWGDQTWEEMAIAFFEVAIPRRSEVQELSPMIDAKGRVAAESPASAKPAEEKSTSEFQPAVTVESNRFVDAFFERFDENKDGLVIKSEMPLAQQRYGFRTLDQDGNGRIDRSEVEQEFLRRQK